MPKEKCFIIAPISTSPARAALHLNDDTHCEHVIDHLFVPAVDKAGFEPIKPKAKGANLIHAEIVQNLQTTALVLCDMSGLNPNVFFELGIRTAMNKPICLTIDEATKDLPFDLETVNHHQYASDLRPWVLPDEVDKLASHIKESAIDKENALWKYFSLRVKAEASESPSPTDKLDLLVAEFDALRKQITDANIARREPRLGWELHAPRPLNMEDIATAGHRLLREADKLGILVTRDDITPDGMISFNVPAETPDDLVAVLLHLARRMGINFEVKKAARKLPGGEQSEPFR